MKTTFDSAVASSFVKSLIVFDPALAEQVCKNSGLDFTREVIKVVKDQIEHALHLGTTPEKNLRLTIEQIGIDEVQSVFSGMELTDEILIPLCVLLPEVLVSRRQEIVSFLALPIRRNTSMRSIEEALPGVTAEVIAAFNDDSAARDLSDEDLIAKIRQISHGNPSVSLGFASDLYDRFLAADIAGRMAKRSSTGGLIDELWADSFPADRRQAISKSIVDRLAAQKHYLLAADAAKWSDLRQAQVEMARVAYAGCLDRRQFKDAALICKRHQIEDDHGAAALELERLDKEKSYDEAAKWAVQFDLPFPEKTALTFGITSHLYDAERCMRGNSSDVVKKIVRHRLRSEFSLVSYYHVDKGLFTDEETVDDLSRAAIANGPRHIWNLDMLAGLKGLGRDSCREQIVRKIITGWISNFRDDSVSDDAKSLAKTFAQIPEDEVVELARRTAIELADKGRWERFLEICEAWGFADLTDTFRQLKGMLTPNGRWREDITLLGACLNFEPDGRI